MTDSFLTLGLGGVLVGETDFCPPSERYPHIRRVGGPKDARVEDVKALEPDLVILNQEENSLHLMRELESLGAPVWVTFPRTVREAIADLQELARIYAVEDISRQVVWLERAVDWLERSRSSNPIRVFCPVWREGPSSAPEAWITFNHDTYAHDLLELCGAENVFGGNESARYPRIAPADVWDTKPDLILLPSEPFVFTDEDIKGIGDLLHRQGGMQNSLIRRIDGRLVFWHGTRLGESVRLLPGLFS
jgi:iron complex transport system substrate-binding protein